MLIFAVVILPRAGRRNQVGRSNNNPDPEMEALARRTQEPCAIVLLVQVKISRSPWPGFHPLRRGEMSQ